MENEPPDKNLDASDIMHLIASPRLVNPEDAGSFRMELDPSDEDLDASEIEFVKRIIKRIESGEEKLILHDEFWVQVDAEYPTKVTQLLLMMLTRATT